MDSSAGLPGEILDDLEGKKLPKGKGEMTHSTQ
jgi:hypothetical protein